MGVCFSCQSTSPPTFDCIRVIHINGYLEDFKPPVTVAQVTGKQANHLLCSSAHLLLLGTIPHLRPNEALQPGRLYFLVPHTVFESDTSPADLATLVTRLTALARSGRQPVSGRPAGPVEAGGSRSAGRGLMGLGAGTWLPELSTIEERAMGRESSNSSSGAYDRVI